MTSTRGTELGDMGLHVSRRGESRLRDVGLPDVGLVDSTTTTHLDEGKRRAFTLIEMLVVVVIISILAGIVFKLVGAGGASSDKATARRQVEQLANAIEEYRAEYGKYPPVAKNASGNQPVAYEYPLRPEYWTRGGTAGAKSLAASLHNVKRTEATVFSFGLMSYLETRVKGRAETAPEVLFSKNDSFAVEEHHWRSENTYRSRDTGSTSDGYIKTCPVKDSGRDVRTAKRIEPYIKDIRSEGHLVPREYSGNYYTNQVSTVYDPWWHQLNYKSDPPYDSYKIWSNGPDGKSGTADDIVAGREN